jgi:hypothetical protein
VNADAEGIIALEASGYVDEVELATIVRKSGQILNASEIKMVSDLIRWTDWEKRIRKYLEGTKHWPPISVTAVLTEIGSVRSAEGRIKQIIMTSTDIQPAVGALDSGAVKRAVQDIMEGSAEAFRKRREKYGF